MRSSIENQACRLPLSANTLGLGIDLPPKAVLGTLLVSTATQRPI